MADKNVAAVFADSNWPEAVRILTRMMENSDASAAPLLLCNRAYCNSKLDLHRRVIADCDAAIAKDSTVPQAYIYKGYALKALGKAEEAARTWKRGYETGKGDLQHMLQLHFLTIKPEDEQERSCLSAPWPLTPPQEKELPPTIKQKSGGKPQTINLDFRLSKAILQVNYGNFEEAISLFDKILSASTDISPDAFVGRGTAYAFQGKLDAAVHDFSRAIEIDKSQVEAWKRRGQARAALGMLEDAVKDFSMALELKPQSTDVLCERGVSMFKLKKYEAAVEDLNNCGGSEVMTAIACSYLGLSLVLIGKHEEGLGFHQRALDLDPSFKEGWINFAQSYQELAESEKAKDCLEKALVLDGSCVAAYYALGVLYRSLGNHREAVNVLSTGLHFEPSNVESRYLRASCYHAIGKHLAAIDDYVQAFNTEVKADSERLTFQFLAFYQREVAIYTLVQLDMSFEEFNLDDHLSPSFKEAWCRRKLPVFASDSNLHLPSELNRLAEVEDNGFTSKAKKLLFAADQLGRKIQYTCLGFSQNRRQYRMAGLAAYEIAKKVRACWKVLKTTSTRKWKRRDGITQNRGGICSSSAGGDCDDAINHILTWRDVYSIAVRWRQLSEPGDSVVWIDKLKEDAFKAGFGSHTPILLGDVKVVRYYSNFQRAFNIVKQVILDGKCVYNAANDPVDLTAQLIKIEKAVDCAAVYDVVAEDFWVVTPCLSSAVEGRILDGTRLTVQKRNPGYEFSIRTPVTPERWRVYEQELDAAWEELAETVCTSPSDREKIANSILRLTFYWFVFRNHLRSRVELLSRYNFMPLARGTAICGYVVLLGLFLAAGFNVSCDIPAGVQVDWEAILCCSFHKFVQSLEWLRLEKHDSELLPDVNAVFFTTRLAIQALSSV